VAESVCCIVVAHRTRIEQQCDSSTMVTINVLLEIYFCLRCCSKRWRKPNDMSVLCDAMTLILRRRAFAVHTGTTLLMSVIVV
jgi:hypothetical protein